MATKASKFETADCSRCGGNGLYGPTCVYNGKCFKCHGTGVLFTKKGQAALSWYQTLQSVPAENLAVDDVVIVDEAVICGGSIGFRRPKCRITAVDVSEAGHTLITAEALSNGRELKQNFDRATLVRVLRADAINEYHISLGLAYQATLTLMGKPRKRAARKMKEAA